MRAVVVFLCAVAIVLASAGPAAAAPGDVDGSFSGDGVVTVAIGQEAAAAAVVLQPDGRIVAAGYTVDGEGRKFALVRYLADGSLDASFGGDGIVVTAVGAQVGGAYAGEARDIAIQPDGKLVAAGYAEGSGWQGGKPALVRYLADGTLDPGFGTGGVVVTTLERPLNAGSVLIEPGRIVVAGTWSYELGDGTDVCEGLLLGYAADGTPESAFGPSGDGRSVSRLPVCFIPPDASAPPAPAAAGLAQQSGGRLIASFSASALRAGVLFGFTGDGRPDAGFGSGGQHDLEDALPACLTGPLALAAGDDIYVLAGCVRFPAGHPVLAHLSPSGAHHWTYHAPQGWPDSAIAVEPSSGRPLIAGAFGNWRATADGQLDLSYGPCGLAPAALGTPAGYVSDATVQPDGRAVVAGSTDDPSSGFAISRYLGGQGPPAVRGAASVSKVAAKTAVVELRTTPWCHPGRLVFEYGPVGASRFHLERGPGVNEPVRELYRSRVVGLRPDTRYEYSVLVDDDFSRYPFYLGAGLESVDQGAFTTLPFAGTRNARHIRSRRALLRGVVEGSGRRLTVHFKYGRRTLRKGPARVLAPDGRKAVTTRIRGLRPSTRYRYRLVVEGRRRAAGSLKSFVTLPSFRVRLAGDLGAASLRVTEPGRARISVMLARSTARRLGIPRLLARGITSFRRAGRRRVPLALTPAGSHASGRITSTQVRVGFRTRRGKLVRIRRRLAVR